MAVNIFYEAVPAEYHKESDQPGELRKIEYVSAGGIKHAYVYVPYGYNDQDAATRYDILYIMHGAGGSAETYFGSDVQPNSYKNMLDNMIAKGDMKPILVVAPSFYPAGNQNLMLLNPGELTRDFHAELVSELIPAVERVYHTHAVTTDLRGLKASRVHRAFGGFSMGGVTTWFTFLQCLDYFFYYLPESGDCWVKGSLGGSVAPDATAGALAQTVRELGYSAADFQIYAATGTGDMFCTPMTAQIEAMKKISDIFVFGNTNASGNLHYILADGQLHSNEVACDYLYDVLRLIYPAG